MARLKLTEDERFLAKQLLMYSQGPGNLAGFDEQPNGAELKERYLDILHLFDLENMELAVRSKILNKTICDAIVLAYRQIQPWQRWWFTYSDTLDGLDSTTLKNIGDRITMYAIEVKGRESTEDKGE